MKTTILRFERTVAAGRAAGYRKGTLMNTLRILPVGILLIGLLGGSVGLADECVTCHSSREFMVQHRTLYDYYVAYEESVHGLAGIGCVECHGGDAATTDQTKAHVGVMERVRYDRIPTTCGQCHDQQHDAFTTSEHFQILENKGTAPNCVTCHGAMEMDFIYAGRVKNTCLICHNQETGNLPDVPDKAEYILSKINIIKGYKSFVTTYAKDQDQVQAIADSYTRLSTYWHRFDLGEVEPETENLLGMLRKAKAQAMKDRREK